MNKEQMVERLRKLASKRVVLLRMIRIRRMLKRLEVMELLEGK